MHYPQKWKHHFQIISISHCFISKHLLKERVPMTGIQLSQDNEMVVVILAVLLHKHTGM